MYNPPKVSIHLVVWNGMKYLPDLLHSFSKQTFQDFAIIVVDNYSQDGSVEFIREQYPHITVLQNFNNLGFSKAHNQAMKLSKSEYVLIVNQDIILDSCFVELLVKEMDSFPQLGVCGGKIMKIESKEDLLQKIRPDILDSTGIAVLKKRRFYDKGAGEVDKGQYQESEEVFGVSCAVALFRKKALDEIKIEVEGVISGETVSVFEYFDEDYFMYKEDLDLVWRLRLANWHARYIPKAESYHYRGGYGSASDRLLDVVRNRFKKSKLVNRTSYRNHLFTLLKNERPTLFWKHFIHIAWYELQKFLFVLVFEPRTLAALVSGIRLLPKMRLKRSAVQKMVRVRDDELTRWFK